MFTLKKNKGIKIKGVSYHLRKVGKVKPINTKVNKIKKKIKISRNQCTEKGQGIEKYNINKAH